MHNYNGSVRFDLKYELQCNLKPKFPKNCPTNVPFYCNSHPSGKRFAVGLHHMSICKESGALLYFGFWVTYHIT